MTTLLITGSNFRVDTEVETLFKQLKDIRTNYAHPVIEISRCEDVVIGPLNVVGNIGDDLDEHHHAVVVAKSRNVSIVSIFARDVRGDALYCYGRDTSDDEKLDNLRVGNVSGSNIFRNLVSIAGGHVSIGEIINAGPVGYRDLDIEPNAEGRYQPAEVIIGKAVVGTLEVTSDDPKTRSLSIKIGNLDADGRRIQPSSPPYPKAPGRNGYALGLASVTHVDIARAVIYNYASYAISLGPNHGAVRFSFLRLVNCNFDEHTFNSAIAKRGPPESDQLIIDHIECNHPNKSKWLIHSDQFNMPVLIGGGEISNGLLAVNCLVDARNLTINAGGASGPAANILVRCPRSKLKSLSLSDAQDATLLFESPDCSLVAVSGSVAAIADLGSPNVTLSDSTIVVHERKNFSS